MKVDLRHSLKKFRNPEDGGMLRETRIIDCVTKRVIIEKSVFREKGYTVDAVREPPRSDMDENMMWRHICKRSP